MAKPGVLLLHGWMTDHRLWDEVRARLPPGESGPVVAPDLTGLTFDAQVVQALAAADIVGMERFVAVGHCLGAQVALLLAKSNPDRVSALVLAGPAPPRGVVLPQPVADQLSAAAADRAALRTWIELATRTSDPAIHDRLVAMGTRWSPGGAAATFTLWTHGSRRLDPADLRLPTSVIATDDPLLPPKLVDAQIVRKLPGARLRIVRSAGHFLPVEAPDAVVDAVRQSLRDVG